MKRNNYFLMFVVGFFDATHLMTVSNIMPKLDMIVKACSKLPIRAGKVFTDKYFAVQETDDYKKLSIYFMDTFNAIGSSN